MRRRAASPPAYIALGAATLALLSRGMVNGPLLEAQRGIARPLLHLLAPDDEEIDGIGCDPNTLDRGITLPTGAPTSLGCDQARAIVAQARTTLAAPPLRVDPAKFAEATSDWLDPHGLWSVAPDAPVGASLRREAAALLGEMHAPVGSGPCPAALRVGEELERWSRELDGLFDEGYRRGLGSPPATLAEAWELMSSAPFEDGEVTRSARELARELGREVGALRARFGDPLARYADAVRERTAPSMTAEGWARAVIAAAVRAYVPQLDAHGAWAPLEEEVSIYDLDLEAHPPARLWQEMTRTAIGVRIDRGALPPLADGDVVLRIQDLPISGMSVEQAEQLAVLSDVRPGTTARVALLRRGAPAPLEVTVAPAPPASGAQPPEDAAPTELPLDLVRYADGKVAVIAIPDVPDDLGDRVAAALLRARAHEDLRGVMLDVRANGGGSTDGAIAALGLFLPGVPLFPMRRRDGGVEVERSPDVPPGRGWSGPLAVLVDGDSASAAEMIAGAIGSYRRGVVIGDRTYGKGCAQEYLDDDAHVGVLRLTTLLYALPDGAPVQKVGIVPQVQLSLPATNEREARVDRALGPWRGPDVRDLHHVREVPWPAHAGRVGPCREETVCRALRSLGAVPAAAR
ncbi:S41 family peptidase [Sorangium sp. So ce131]|uniref:S41 family peptidase n=1 Tax=Sorangium sp. So ce131 TaxID=3133282 RepID=UPI003F63AD11